MKTLRKMCVRHSLVPKSLKVELCDYSPGVLMYGGGFGDVWNHEFQGREVAVKVLKTYLTSDLEKIVRVGRHWCFSLPT